ncbi:TetR/AcrR family transcriptional regulator [Bacillus sp. FJAT-50079]|uniref:TetR/AcrR family transcriptional regulator n=1 Tax=Bacillus sp. FJAT-50079 TaxID=2833577 RepID=UPI001BC97C29|nr:TetR/AcrR family transcriptional regulator [Bacillus sp. FJAT-50079]MBS4207337.1 TetR family transcriptional regulator [Bacillus sp. FJAT-50079]
MTKRANKKVLLIETAKQLLMDDKLETLTLDAVAKAANMSKGGLLYHFPTKEALLNSLTTYIFEKMQQRFLEIAAELPESSYRYTLALIQLTEEDLIANAEVNVALLAQTTLPDELKQQLSQMYQQLLSYQDHDTIDQQKQLFVRFALDGLYYNQLFKLAAPTQSEVDQTLNYLKSFIVEQQ